MGTTCAFLSKRPEAKEMLRRPSIESGTVLCQGRNMLYTTPLEAGSPHEFMLSKDLFGTKACGRDKALATFHSHPAGGRWQASMADFEHSVFHKAKEMCVLEMRNRELSCYDVKPLARLKNERGARELRAWLKNQDEISRYWTAFLNRTRTCSVKVKR